jgi:hypothetical protein
MKLVFVLTALACLNVAVRVSCLTWTKRKLLTTFSLYRKLIKFFCQFQAGEEEPPRTVTLEEADKAVDTSEQHDPIFQGLGGMNVSLFC